jgi:hypothetical protein
VALRLVRRTKQRLKCRDIQGAAAADANHTSRLQFLTALRLKALSDRLNDPAPPFTVPQKAFRADHAIRAGRQVLRQIPWNTGWYVSEGPAFIARIRMGTGLRFGVRAS